MPSPRGATELSPRRSPRPFSRPPSPSRGASSSRMVSAMRLRSKSTSTTFTLTTSPAFTTSRRVLHEAVGQRRRVHEAVLVHAYVDERAEVGHVGDRADSRPACSTTGFDSKRHTWAVGAGSSTGHRCSTSVRHRSSRGLGSALARRRPLLLDRTIRLFVALHHFVPPGDVDAGGHDDRHADHRVRIGKIAEHEPAGQPDPEQLRIAER